MKTITHKLINYSALASGILAINNGTAQVIYTDIEPDILLYSIGGGWMEDEGMQYLDFNFDGNIDVGLSFDTDYNCYACPVWTVFNLELYGSNKIAVELAEACYLSSTFGSGYSSTECIIPAQNVGRILIEGDTLSAFTNWDVIPEIFETHSCGYYGEGCMQGEFDFNDSKQFLGFQINSADTNYCWLRLSWKNDSLFIKDFACSSVPEEMIIVKDKIADEVSGLVLYSDSCTGGTDELKVQFNKALDEETVSEYRIMVSPGYGFSANEALLISPENYLSILPTGNDIDIRLPKNFPNYIGDELPILTDIKVTVFSISKFPFSNECSMVISNPAQIGVNSFPETPTEVNLSSTEIAYNSSDIFVSVNELIDTTLSSKFRIMMMLGSVWDEFTLENAESALPENYIEILPTQEFNIQLPENMKTWNGDFLEPFIFYRAVILVLPKDGITCINKLSDVSNFASFKANPNAIENVSQDFNIYYKEGLILISSGRNIQGTISVLDVKGVQVFEIEIYGDDIKVPFINPPGIYIVKLETETGIYPQKIVVQ